MDSTWPPPFGIAAVNSLPPFDRDRLLRRTVVAQWLAHVPDGVPSAETVKTFADQLATRVKGRSAHRYLFSLRDVLEHLFPEADLGSALPRRLDRVFSTLPFNDWPEVGRSDLSRARASMNPRTWQTARESVAKYFALDPAPWPPHPRIHTDIPDSPAGPPEGGHSSRLPHLSPYRARRRARQGGLDLDG